VALCRSSGNRRSGGTYRLRTSVSRWLQTVCSHLLTLVPRSWISLPWRWKRYVPPKRRFIQDVHGATSQKTAFFIATAVKTSNLPDMILTGLKFWNALYLTLNSIHVTSELIVSLNLLPFNIGDYDIFIPWKNVELFLYKINIKSFQVVTYLK
jgi:hypothetical protein